MFYDEVYESPEFRKFKFRELKVYASTEWLADNKKKYRHPADSPTPPQAASRAAHKG